MTMTETQYKQAKRSLAILFIGTLEIALVVALIQLLSIY
jgi:hypothetical protein